MTSYSRVLAWNKLWCHMQTIHYKSTNWKLNKILWSRMLIMSIFLQANKSKDEKKLSFSSQPKHFCPSPNTKGRWYLKDSREVCRRNPDVNLSSNGWDITDILSTSKISSLDLTGHTMVGVAVTQPWCSGGALGTWDISGEPSAAARLQRKQALTVQKSKEFDYGSACKSWKPHTDKYLNPIFYNCKNWSQSPRLGEAGKDHSGLFICSNLPAHERKSCHLRPLLFIISQPVGLWNKRDGRHVNAEKVQQFFSFGRSHFLSLVNGRVKTQPERQK